MHRRLAHRLFAFAAAFGVLVGLFATGPLAAQADDPAKLVLVLDSSGSMAQRVGGDSKISIAKSALNLVVKRLPATSAVGLRVYGATVENRGDKGACTDSQLVVPIGTGNRTALTSEIKKYKPYGETPISYSLKQAASDLGKSGRRTIVLVSDGEETCDVDPCVTARTLAKQGINLKIDVIGLRVQAKARAQLECIADRGNGTYYDADSREELEDSLDKLSTRAFRPFKLTGTPVEGATEKAGAPVLTGGQYLDNIPGDQSPLFYRLKRTSPRSTLHVGFTARLGSSKLQIAGLVLRLRDAQGIECSSGYASAISGAGTAPLVSGQVDSWRREADSTCNTASQLSLEVASSNDLGGQKFELVVVEEPAVVSTRHLPPVGDGPKWASMKGSGPYATAPVAGTNISDAPVLAPGRYQTKILTGESQVFAVDADWGQWVQFEAVIAPRTGALARALDVNSGLDVQLLGPVRGRYERETAQGQPYSDITMNDDSRTYRIYAATPVIRYLQRTTFDGDQAAATPGKQYIVLNQHREDSNFLVPYTFTIKVFGRAGTGAPQYVRPATPTPSPTPTPTPTATPAPTTATPGTDPAGPQGVSPGLVVGVGVGALVLGVGGTVAASALRRRRAAPRH